MSEVYNAQGRINKLSVLCIDAYGVAVKKGFEGTVEEWLESLKGEDGVDIVSVEQTGVSSADGGDNVITVTLSNGKTSTFVLKNGSDGVSPTIDVSKSGKTTTLTITDANGTKTAEIKDGEDGAGGGSGGVSDYNELENRPVLPLPVHEIYEIRTVEGTTTRIKEISRVWLNHLQNDVLYFVPANHGYWDAVYKGVVDGDEFIETVVEPTLEPFRGLVRMRYKNWKDGLDEFHESYKIEDECYAYWITLNWKDNTKTELNSTDTWEAELFNSYLDNQRPFVVAGEYNLTSVKYVNAEINNCKSQTLVAAAENAAEQLAAYKPPNSDWNQNDSTAMGYIRGRTHYEEPDPDNASDTVTWDGVVGDRLSIPMDEESGVYVVQISESAPTVADLVGGSLTVVGMAEEPQTLTLTEEYIMSENGMTQVGGDTPFLMIFEQDMSEGDFTIPAGTYSIWMGGAVYVSQVTCVTPAFGTKIIHKLPEKFIPEMSSVTLISPGGKRFEVTVNDNGALRVTEITE